jgi:hypothetical protein
MVRSARWRCGLRQAREKDTPNPVLQQTAAAWLGSGKPQRANEALHQTGHAIDGSSCLGSVPRFGPYWLTCTTVAGGKPLKCVLLAAE